MISDAAKLKVVAAAVEGVKPVIADVDALKAPTIPLSLHW